MNLARLTTPEAGQKCLNLLASMQQNLPERGLWAGQSLVDALLFVGGKAKSWRPADIDIFDMGTGALPPGYAHVSVDSQLAQDSDVLRYGKSGMVEFIVTRFLTPKDLLESFDFSFCQIGLDIEKESFVHGPLFDVEQMLGTNGVSGVIGQFQRPTRLACRIIEKHEAGWLSEKEAAAAIWWLTYLIAKTPQHLNALGRPYSPTKRTTPTHIAKFEALAMSVGSQLRLQMDPSCVFLFFDGVSAEEAVEGLELHHGAKQIFSTLPAELNEFYAGHVNQVLESFKPRVVSFPLSPL